MISLLLAIIYIAFISLGLPDSLLGSAWPVMQSGLGVPFSFAGIISMIIAGGTIVSSLLSDRLTRKIGVGCVTAFSVLMTAAALFGFSVSSSFAALCLWAVPYGLGAGAVDAALNNYVALHFKTRHMSWLHCFWGIGVSVSPYIMSWFLVRPSGWHGGYRAVSCIQFVLSALLFLSLPLWKKTDAAAEKPQVVSMPSESGGKAHSLLSVLNIRGVPLVLISFFSYCALESTAGLWAATYFVQFRMTEPEIAAKFASFFYIGIMAGRFANGFIAEKAGDRMLVRFGSIVAAAGIVLILLPFRSNAPALAGLVVAGLGCAPVYPSIIHATPAHFGRENSQAVIGMQMAGAYTGSTFMPPLFGILAERFSLAAYPFFLLVFALFLLFGTETLECVLANSGRQSHPSETGAEEKNT